MIPSALVVLDRLPRDANGKLDRRALGAPVVSVTSRQLHARPAGDALERELIAIWEQHLKRRGLGATDDFFELGGDSLLAAQTVLAIERATHVRLSPNALYVAPTVAQLAAHLRSQAGAAPSPGGEGGRGQPGDGAADSILVPMQPLGSRPPLFFVHDHGGSLVGYADLVRRLGLDQPCYGLRSPWERSPRHGAGDARGDGDTLSRCDPRPAAGRALPAVRDLLRGRARVRGRAAVDRTRRAGRTAGDHCRHAIRFSRPRVGECRPAVRVARRPRALHPANALLRCASRRSHLEGSAALSSRSIEAGDPVAAKPLARACASARRASSLPERSALREHHDRVFQRYEARPFGGRATLFLSSLSVEHYSSDPARDWRPLAVEGVDVGLIEAAGGDMLSEPHVEVLATHLQRDLTPPQHVPWNSRQPSKNAA